MNAACCDVRGGNSNSKRNLTLQSEVVLHKIGLQDIVIDALAALSYGQTGKRQREWPQGAWVSDVQSKAERRHSRVMFSDQAPVIGDVVIQEIGRASCRERV